MSMVAFLSNCDAIWSLLAPGVRSLLSRAVEQLLFISVYVQSECFVLYLSVVGLLSLHCVGSFSTGLDSFDLLV